MRRPLCIAALCLVVIAALRLDTEERAGPGSGGMAVNQPAFGDPVGAVGQVYQKDETSIYIKSAVLFRSAVFGQKIPFQQSLICETDQAQDIPLGCFVALEGEFAPVSRAANPGEFDAAGYYGIMGIGGRIRKTVIVRQSGSCWRIREGLFRLKCFLKERLYRIMPEKEAAFMSALLLGDKKGMDSSVKDLYRRNGILHILSISSLHITIIGMTVYRLLRKVGVPVCPAALSGSILLLLYGGMTGFGVSACRAIGMYLIKMFGEAVGRTYDMLTALAVMGAAMVMKNPLYLHSSGFLLSFASVLGIGILYPVISSGNVREQDRGDWNARTKRLSVWKCRILNSVSQSFFASLSITVATLPVQLWFFYEIPVYSVFLNLIVIPFMKPIMITGLLAMAVPGLWWLGMADCLILQGYEFLCGCFDRLPFHTWNPGRPAAVWVAAYYLAVLAAAAAVKYLRTEKIPVKAFGVGLLCLAVLLLGIRPPSKNSITFLYVGQGDCILVRTSSGQNYVFDCGSTSRSGVGKYVLIPCLKYYGIRNIDALFLSHPDADHVNGALELLSMGRENNITVRQLVLPGIEERARQEQLGELAEAAQKADMHGAVLVGYLSAGEAWDCGGAVFTCLHPERSAKGENPNAYSLCFLVEFREERRRGSEGGTEKYGWNALLTGDVEGSGEKAMIEELGKRADKEVWVLKAAHHGSRNSTSRELLDLVSPKLAVISCGSGNRYGHPHRELLERLEDSGALVVRTDQTGAVTVFYEDGGIGMRVYCLP